MDAPFLHSPWRDWQSATLIAATTLALSAQIGLVSQLFSHLAPVLGEAGAGATMSLATACAILGRTVLGRVLPPGHGRRAVGALNLIVQVAGSVLLLASGSASILVAGCVLFGLGLGNVTSLPPLIAQAEFRQGDVPTVVGLVTAASQAGYAFAPAVFGLIGAACGTAWSFGAAAAIQFAAAAVLLSAGARGRLSRGAANPRRG